MFAFRSERWRRRPSSPGAAPDVPSGTRLRLPLRFFTTAALALSLYFIAGNIGSGWIYLLSSSLLTALALGLLLPLAQTAQVAVSQEAPAEAVAGESVPVTVTLSRRRRALPLYLLRVGYHFRGSEAADRTETEGARAVARLDEPLAMQQFTGRLVRGVHALGTVSVCTSFPLGLAWWERRFPPPQRARITVYPKVVPVSGLFLYRMPAAETRSSGLSPSSQSARQSTSTRGLREYVRGDSPRHVHWASSARTGRLMVREFEAEGLPQFDVLLDLAGPWTSREQFELAVCAAASLISLGHRLGLGPDLILNPGAADPELPPAGASPGLKAQMETLARVHPPGEDDRLRAADRPGAGGERALLVVRAAGGAPLPLSASYFLDIGDGYGGTGREHGRAAGPTSYVASEEDLENL